MPVGDGPAVWREFLVRVTTSPCGPARELSLAGPRAKRLFHSLQAQGWRFRQTGERNLILWRCGRLMNKTAERLVVLPNPELPLETRQRTYICVKDTIRRVIIATAIEQGASPDQIPMSVIERKAATTAADVLASRRFEVAKRAH